jgi:hypothetical protein
MALAYGKVVQFDPKCTVNASIPLFNLLDKCLSTRNVPFALQAFI